MLTLSSHMTTSLQLIKTSSLAHPEKKQNVLASCTSKGKLCCNSTKSVRQNLVAKSNCGHSFVPLKCGNLATRTQCSRAVSSTSERSSVALILLENKSYKKVWTKLVCSDSNYRTLLCNCIYYASFSLIYSFFIFSFFYCIAVPIK